MSTEKRKKSEFKSKINLREILTNEEIKYLRNINPELNSLFKTMSNIKNFTTNPLNFNTSFSPILISKDKFFKIILEQIRRRYIRDNNKIMSKIISIIIKEILNISKLVEQNAILNEL